MGKRLAVYGGSFNPPGLHHREVAMALAARFDEVVVVPCGPRPDKPATNDVAPVVRAHMVDLTFRGLPGVRVELFDLEQATFTRTHELTEVFAREGEVWHVVGVDLVRGGQGGDSFIQTRWEQGQRIWDELRYAVVVHAGEVYDEEDLPPRSEVVTCPAKAGESRRIRERVFHHEDIAGLVTPAVDSYIQRCWLYRGKRLPRSTTVVLPEPRLLIVHDEDNDHARSVAATFDHLASAEAPNCILVVGGDGTMLAAIRKHWRRRLPFLGLNAGHRGFLLNGAAEFAHGKFPETGLTVEQCPLLYVETRDTAGEIRHSLAFNDAWLERASGQSAWIDVAVDGARRIPRLAGDGILVSTAAGSTAYARAMGATPLLVETAALLMVGSNVSEPPKWKSALLSLDAEVSLGCLDPRKRPVTAFVDGKCIGPVESMRVRVSRIAAAELAFCEGHDMAEKIAQIQFPSAAPEQEQAPKSCPR